MAPTKKNRKASSSSKPKQPRKLSLEELLQAAEQALTTADDPRHAIALYTAALPKAVTWQQQVDVLEKRAEVHVSIENQDEARRDYQAALERAEQAVPPPADGGDDDDDDDDQQIEILERKAALCMYIGQLSTATDALSYYLKGIEYLRDSITSYERLANQQQSSSSVVQQIQQQLATALCTVAELYLTDLCFEENAEKSCEAFLQQALQLDDKCPDALQAMCSLRLSQNRGTEAAPFILQVFEGLQTGCRALASLVGLREDTHNTGATELLELQEVQDLPGFEFRCQTSKLLLECAGVCEREKAQCAQAAIDVLGSLLAENDDVVEIWMLVGDAFAMLGGEDEEQKELPCHYWERALSMLTVVQKSLLDEQQDAEDMEEEDAIQEQLDGVVCQMEDLRSKLEEVRGVDAMEE